MQKQPIRDRDAHLTAKELTPSRNRCVVRRNKKAKKNKAKALFSKFRVIFNPFPAAANERA
jgi:hypothetical protein